MKYYEGQLLKVSEADDPYHPNNIETGREVNLTFVKMPEVEESFRGNRSDRLGYMYATSVVKEIITYTDDYILFKTMNSVYRLSYIEVNGE